MNSLKYSVFAIFICCVSSTPVEVTELSKGISEFGQDLYSQCVETQPGNMIISPLSVATALAILSQGATGRTFDELKTGLHLSNDKTVTANQFLEYRNALEKSADQVTFSIANKVYVKQGLKLSKNFQDVAVSKFKSGAESLNFAENEESAKTINTFVEEKTNGKIKNLIQKDDLDSNTRSVIVNAIYFKGNWAKTFDEKSTKKQDFKITEHETKSVDFMYKSAKYDFVYSKDLESQVLEMKYANSNMTFVIVLPRKVDGLSEVESKLKTYDWSKITEGMFPLAIEVKIPKFKLEYEIEMSNVLSKMGMAKMFTDTAELEGVLESGEPLKVSKVIHKAFIEVDEKGTEAAAATAVLMAIPASYPPRLPPQFIADHPFLFYIRDTETNTVLFSGRVTKF